MHGRALRSATLGFTLVETLTVVMIIAILIAVGAPSYRSVTTSSRLSTEVNDLLGALQFARSQALKEGRPVTACISNDGESCAAGTGWHGGWIVFSDTNANGTVDGGETVLRVRRPFSGEDVFEEDDGLNTITFNREGFALNLPDAGVLLKLHDRTSNPAFTRCLSIAMAGMMTTRTHVTAPASCT